MWPILQGVTENYYEVCNALQSVTGITMCNSYYKVWQKIITKHDRYYKVWQKITTKCDMYNKMRHEVIIKYDRYYRLRKLLESVTGIAKPDNYHKEKHNTLQASLHTFLISSSSHDVFKFFRTQSC